MLNARFDATSIPSGGAIHVVFGAEPVAPDGYVPPDPVTTLSVVCEIGSGWTDAQRADVSVASRVETGSPAVAVAAVAWREASRIATDGASGWAGAARAASLGRMAWDAALRAAWLWAEREEAATRAAWAWADIEQAAIRVAGASADSWASAIRVVMLRRDVFRHALRSGISRSAPWQAAQRAGAIARDRWQEGRRPPLGRWGVPPLPPIPPGCYTPPHGRGIHARFDVRTSASRGPIHVVFRCASASGVEQLIIPTLRTYLVINDVSLLRLPDNEPVLTTGLDLSWDVDTWCVGWSATLPASELDKIMPDEDGAPAVLQATINGTAVTLLAEGVTRDRQFGSAQIRVTGRGIAALLGTPYSPTVTRTSTAPATAQQLAQDAIGTDWGLDWQLVDWLVPAGAWSHQGAAIDAVKRIAEAAGGYILGHRTLQAIHVRPRYPTLPWEWATETPALVIPAAIAATESTAWVRKAQYNRVFVSGQGVGVIGDIKRAGTAGELLAPGVVDALITEAFPARARGAAILADTGAQALITVRMPVMEEYGGVADLGTLVEYNDGSTPWRGLVRGVRVSVGWPEVYQTLEIETHA